jgi:hypothetical protein
LDDLSFFLILIRALFNNPLVCLFAGRAWIFLARLSLDFIG